MPGVFIGKGSKIGKGTIVYSNVSIYDQVEVGRNSIIHAGVVIGSDGLGFAKENNKWKELEFFKSDYIASKDVNAWLGLYEVTKNV